MLRFLAIGLAATILLPGAANAQPRAEVMNQVTALLDALQRKDVAAFKALFAPGAVFMSKRAGAIRRLTADQLADSLASIDGEISEPIGKPTIHIDDDLAVVWAPYRFVNNGEVIHCGTDLISLIKIEDNWRIVGVADNARTQCR